MISFFRSFCGFSGVKLGVTEGESLNKSSIPEVDWRVDWGVLSIAFGASVFSASDASAAAETIIAQN